MNRRVPLLPLLVISILCTPTTAWARHYGSRGRAGYGGGGTVYGSMASGMGNLIRAQGAYNQMTAQALVTLEQAKSAAIKNKLEMTQTYYQLRRLNETEHAAQERAKLELYATPHENIPRLTAAQLDPVTGEIKWMPVLLDPDFAAERLQLQNMFLQRAAHDPHVTNTEVAHVVDAFREKLDAKHDRLTTNDFFAARHFLEALEFESRYTGFENHAPQANDQK
jgi:hypothetical protein